MQVSFTCLLVLFVCVLEISAFCVMPSTPLARVARSDMSMLFNFGKKSGSGSGGGKGKAIEITVNGKTLSADPGQKAVNLRKELTKNKIDVYSLRGKFDNCGGSGICGRCAVEVVDGAKNFNPASKNEQNTINITKDIKKKDNVRLSCCPRVSGPVTIKTLKV